MGSIYLKPGDLLITRDPCEVTTVLGSCVAIILFNTATGEVLHKHLTPP
jgi:chemotaxis receptor (MCP) glutamine deamidase CheD